MHIELLVEDSSGARLIEDVIVRILGDQSAILTWRIHSYKGLGRLPKGLVASPDASKRILLDRLPSILRGYGKTPGVDWGVVVVDSDEKDCKMFLKELKGVVEKIIPQPQVMFRLAIEEMEAWYL